MQAYMPQNPAAHLLSGADSSAKVPFQRAVAALLRKALIPLVTFALCPFVFTYAAFRMIGQIDSFTLLWPVSGLVIGLALSSPCTHWQGRWAQRTVAGVGVTLGALAAGQSLWMATSWAALTIVDMLLAARFIGPHLRSFDDLKKRASIIRFVVATTVTPVISAVAVTLPLALRHGVPWLQTTCMSALSDSLGMAIVLPACLFVPRANTGFCARSPLTCAPPQEPTCSFWLSRPLPSGRIAVRSSSSSSLP